MGTSRVRSAVPSNAAYAAHILANVKARLSTEEGGSPLMGSPTVQPQPGTAPSQFQDTSRQYVSETVPGPGGYIAGQTPYGSYILLPSNMAVDAAAWTPSTPPAKKGPSPPPEAARGGDYTPPDTKTAGPGIRPGYYSDGASFGLPGPVYIQRGVPPVSSAFGPPAGGGQFSMPPASTNPAPPSSAPPRGYFGAPGQQPFQFQENYSPNAGPGGGSFQRAASDTVLMAVSPHQAHQAWGGTPPKAPSAGQLQRAWSPTIKTPPGSGPEPALAPASKYMSPMEASSGMSESGGGLSSMWCGFGSVGPSPFSSDSCSDLPFAEQCSLKPSPEPSLTTASSMQTRQTSGAFDGWFSDASAYPTSSMEEDLPGT